MALKFGDLSAIIRCSPFIIGLPSVLAFVMFEAPKIIEAFDQTVAPLVADAMPDGATQERVSRALLGCSLKVSLAMSCYTTIASVEFRPDLAVMGSSFTRVYDDLFDTFSQDRLDQRLAAMFAGGTLVPASNAEALLLALYRTTETALRRPRSDPIFRMVAEMHRYQCMSRRQREPDITVETVRLITRGKGGLGTAVLFALFKPEMAAAEQEVIFEFGYILQLLDDVNDVDLDRADGVATEATLGACTLSDIGTQMRRLRRHLAVFYPGSSQRRLKGMLLLMLIGASLRRRRDGRRAGPGPRGRRLFFSPVENIYPDDGPVAME
jgi:hypothetical protein